MTLLLRPVYAVGTIDLPDRPEPERLRLPSVLVAGAAESGPRYAITRGLTDVDLDVEKDDEP